MDDFDDWNDDLDDDFDDRDDDLDDDFDEDEDGGEEAVTGTKMTDDEIEALGSLDGGSDSGVGNHRYSGFGMSVDVEELTDKQRERYEMGYEAGYDSGADFEDGEEW